MCCMFQPLVAPGQRQPNTLALLVQRSVGSGYRVVGMGLLMVFGSVCKRHLQVPEKVCAWKIRK